MASSRPIYFYIAALHILAALLLFTRGARTFPLPSPLSWSWGSDWDLALFSSLAALLLLTTALFSRAAPLLCYSRCRFFPASLSLGATFSLLALYALVKVTAAPNQGPLFWAQACLLFGAACVEGSLAQAELAAVLERAQAAAAARCGLADGGGSTAGGSSPAAAPASPPKFKGASMLRLLSLSRPDIGYISCGFFALLIAAVAGTFVPGLTGSAIDALSGRGAAFNSVLLQLLGVTALGAVFTGLRGWCFTVAISRLKVRLRDMLLRAILEQELGFFDATPTGELTSRLSADTTVVGDQVALNVNVFLRSAISAGGCLLFMISLSWRLTLLAFCTVPPIILISSLYGKFVQDLSKRSQTRLAVCNNVAEEALAALSTVRSFGAEQRVGDEHGRALGDFYVLQKRQADAYAGYACITTFLPGGVTALVLYVGAALVGSGSITEGTLVSI